MQTAAAAALSLNGRVWELVDRECVTSSLSVCGGGFGGVSKIQKSNSELSRRRAGDDDPLVREGILLAINGVAAGLRNSG